MPYNKTSITEDYADADCFNARSDEVGRDVTGYTDADIQQALRSAAEYLDATYGSRFIGEVATFGQPLAWPRKRAKLQGRFFPDNEIPEKIIAASCELAFMILTGVSGNQEPPVIENILCGLIQPEQSEAGVFGSIARVQHDSL